MPRARLGAASSRRLAARPQIRPVAERALPLLYLLEAHCGAGGYHPVSPTAIARTSSPVATWGCSRVAALFAFVAGAHALAPGLLAGNPDPDASPCFFSVFEALFAEGLAAAADRIPRISTDYAIGTCMRMKQLL